MLVYKSRKHVRGTRTQRMFEEFDPEIDEIDPEIEEISYALITVNDFKTVRIDRKGMSFETFLDAVSDRLNDLDGDLCDYEKNDLGYLFPWYDIYDYEDEGFCSVYLSPSGADLIYSAVRKFDFRVGFFKSSGEKVVQFHSDEVEVEDGSIQDEYSSGSINIYGTVTIIYGLLVDDDGFGAINEDYFITFLEQCYRNEFSVDYGICITD